MTKDFDQWVSLWKSNPKRIDKKFSNYLFVVVYPNNLEWDFGVEKQTQITTMHVSGGRTGAGTGHHIEFVHQKELYEFLKTQTVYDDGLQSYYTHAMIVSVGMVFDMTPSMTPIDEFYHWAESNMLFCKAHIMAKKEEPAYLHHQHIELNLTQWREIGCPDIFGKRIWRNYDRSHINFHDDYTPLHLTPLGLPRIDNFSNTERSKKSFAYGHMEDRKKLQKLCGPKRIMILKEHTTTRSNQLDHIIMHSHLSTKVFATSFINHTSDHRTITFRIPLSGNNFSEHFKRDWFFDKEKFTRRPDNLKESKHVVNTTV